jgi:outer membrane biogenesis lipoprotein LolB
VRRCAGAADACAPPMSKETERLQDFRHRVKALQQDKWYQFTGRLAYKESAGSDDVVNAYEVWNAKI